MNDYSIVKQVATYSTTTMCYGMRAIAVPKSGGICKLSTLTEKDMRNSNIKRTTKILIVFYFT